METLTVQWWNALTRSLNLQAQFQLAQGNVAVGTTSQSIWSIMDAIPPKSLVQYWTPGGYNSFSSNYGSVLSRIHSSSSGSFQQIMGDYYSAWQSYLAAHPPSGPFPAALLTAFQSWAFSNMPPEQAESAYTAFQSAVIDPIGQAQQMWQIAGGTSGTKAYTPSIETLDNTISMAPSGSVQLNSQTESSDASKTWAQGSVEGFYDVFFGEAGASYDASTVVVTNAGVDISIQFQHVTTVPVMPLETGSIVAGPTTFQAWYVPSALQTAYNNNNYQIWQPGSPDWNSFFGPSGSMPRATMALLIVDGISVTLNSIASIDEASQEEVKASFAAGFFPFFGTEGNGGWSNSFTYNDSGQIVATSSCPVGSPQILGIIVADLPNVIASPAVMAAVRTRRATRSRKSIAPRRPRQQAVAQVVPAPAVVITAWTATALQGLHNLGINPQLEVLIVNYVNNWAQNGAPGWPLNVNQFLNSPMPQYTATARVVAINGANRSVNIVAFT